MQRGVTDQIIVRADRRRRGDHSTACKCPNPAYIRPAGFKKLPNVLQYAINRMASPERPDGIRPSAHPVVVQRVRSVRQRGMYAVTRNLFDALAMAFLNHANIVTGIVELNYGQLAESLSPRDENGEVIAGQAVTEKRISNILRLFFSIGIALPPPDLADNWDRINKTRLPRYIILTDEGFRLFGVREADLIKARELRLHSLREEKNDWSLDEHSLRRAWYADARMNAIISRRTRAAEGKFRRRMASLPFEERKREVASRIFRRHGEDARYIPARKFEKMVWDNLYQLDLVDFGTPPPLH